MAQDAEKWMPVERVKRTTDKVARAYWLQPFFENAQILMPAKHVVGDYTLWQALMDELVLFPQGESMMTFSMAYRQWLRERRAVEQWGSTGIRRLRGCDRNKELVR